MIVTDRMVFLHLHKSGGTFVNRMLRHCLPKAERIGYHLPYREIPNEARRLPVVGTVRNPWAYYVSWFHFQLGLPRPNQLFVTVSDGGSLGFAETITNLLFLSEDEQRLCLLEDGLPESYQPAGINLIKADVANLRCWSGGFYSFLYQRLYDGAAAPNVVRTEQLRDELRPVLQEVGHLPNRCISTFLAEAPRFNVSEHDEPASYFDRRLAGLVAERDRMIIERHGYIFGRAA
jgi:hypothetical protein